VTLILDSLPQIDSPLARVDPRWKLASLLLASALCGLLQTLPPVMTAMGGVCCLVALSKVPFSWYGQRLVGLALFLTPFALGSLFLLPDPSPLPVVGPITISRTGLQLALLICCKAVTIVTLMLILLATAPLNATVHAAYSLHIPGILVQVVLLTHRYLSVLAGELRQLRIALRVRGFRSRANLHSYRTIGHVTGTLLVRGFERAERVGQAMRCRGFDGRFRSMTTFRTRTSDVVMLVVTVGSAACLLAWDIVRR
jgi:cobalt/nickel transport system permease protein